MNNRAVFLDRDGTVNEDFGYSADPNKVHILPGVIQALSILKEHSWLLVIVSNQSGIGRGYYNLEDLSAVQEKIEAELAIDGINLDGFYFCPHAPDERCSCRKPEPGLLFRAASELGINLAHSWMVGDKISDIAAGQRAGCRSILINRNQQSGEKTQTGDNQYAILKPDLLAAAQYILMDALE